MVTRAKVKVPVVEAVAKLANRSASEIKEAHFLWQNLRITKAGRERLAKPFSEIATSYSGGKTISIGEARKLKTVKACIDLTFKRAKGQS